MRKITTLLLAAVLLLSNAVFPVCAMQIDPEDPMAIKDYAAFGAPLMETEPEERVQETIPETQPAQTESTEPETEPVEETISQETIPVETVPAETLAEETVPAETESPTEPTEPDPNAPKGHNGVPLYFQNDYPNHMYGMGTIESNGCSAASLAMVATYMTGHEYLPDEIARYFGGRAENNIARLEMGSDALKLTYRKARDWNDAYAAVQSGKVVIFLVDNGSVFTQSQHFIVATGMNENGKIMVNDSWRPNYDKWDCKEGLQNGFAPDAILAGWSGAWIYDKAAMPEDPFIYYEPAPVRGEPRYDITLTQEEMNLLAKVVWVESRGECESGQQAVAEVVLNRIASDKFPNNLKDVIYGEGQFRSVKFLDKAKPYQLQYQMIENALYGPYILPKDVYYFATTPTNSKVWDRIGGHVFCYAEDK